MRILLEKNDKLQCIKEIMQEYKDIEIIEQEVLKSTSKYDVLMVYCDCIEDISKYRKYKNRNILVVTDNVDSMFIYNLICIIHPLDVICNNLTLNAIKVRIISNIEYLKGEQQ